ncbi:MAG: hydrogenase iron-sulfur subunit, partial [Candidatus Hodarchaeota archaeon]
QGPKDIPTTSMHASAAALKASKLMKIGKVLKDLLTAVVDEDYCDACGFCVSTCPYGAIEVVEGSSFARVMDSKCRGCGICVATCPADAIQLKNWRDSQILAQIKGLFQGKFLSKYVENPQPSVIAFCCDECGYAAADSAGFLRMQYPVNIRILRVPCIGGVDVSHIMNAFKAGADAIMLVGCKIDGCHYKNGSIIAERRVMLTKKLLNQMGIEPERLEIFFVPCIEADKFVEATKLMLERVNELGTLKILS